MQRLRTLLTGALALFVFAILVLTHQKSPRTARIVVNYPSLQNHNGTGFFFKEDRLITATHVIRRSNDGVVTLLAPGFDESTSTITDIGNDRTTIKFEKPLAKTVHKICDSLPKEGIEVNMEGLSSIIFRRTKEQKGILAKIDKNLVFIKGFVKEGSSGGPIIDIKNNCVFGMISNVGLREPKTDSFGVLEGGKINIHKGYVVGRIVRKQDLIERRPK